MNKFEFALAALKLSQSFSEDHHFDFNDKELAVGLGVSLNKIRELIKEDKNDVLHRALISEIPCKECGKDVKVSDKLDFAYCSNCRAKNDLREMPKYVLGINLDRVYSILLEELEKRVKSKGWIVEKKEEKRVLIKNSSLSLAVSINLGFSNLERYFALRGWHNEPLDAYLLISETFSADLVSYVNKDLRCNCAGLQNIFNQDIFDELINHIKIRVEQLNSSNQVEHSLALHGEIYGNLIEVKKHFEEICNNLILYAKQKADVSHSKQGRDYQKYIVALFQLSLMKTKLLGGRNEPDAMGYIFRLNEKKKIWCPFEIKSSKREIFPVSEEALQVRKYCSALTNSLVQQEVDVRYFLLIANDFDQDDSNELAILRKLETDFPRIRVIRFPLKTVVKMAHLFIKNAPIYIPPESLEEFFEKNRYIREEDIITLHRELVKMEEKDAFLFKFIRDAVSKQGT